MARPGFAPTNACDTGEGAADSASADNSGAVGIRFIDPLPPEPPELVQGLLPADGVTLISGPTNIGKSLVAIEIASALTTDTALWGELKAKRKIRRVVYLLGEHTAGTVQRLYKITGLPMGREARIIGPEQLPTDRHLIVRGEVNSETVEQYQQLVAGAELIIVDPLSAFIAGANAENDNTAMRNLVDAFQKLGVLNKAPVLVLGHFGKPARDINGNEEHRTNYASRGASAAEDACPTVYYLKADEGQTYCLSSRKYKGVTPPKRVLLRNDATKVHTLLTSNRPNIEAAKIQFRAKVEQVMAAGLDKTAAVKAVAALEDIKPRTAWNYVNVGVGAAAG